MRALVFALLATAASAAPLEVEVLQQSGPSRNRIDVAVLGDGYTAGEQAVLLENATRIIDGLFAVPPYADYRALFNVKLVHVISNESGASVSGGITRDTALNATFGCFSSPRSICISNGSALTIAAENVPEYDLVIVVVNDAAYGGSGGAVPVVSMATDAIEILRHELGHTLGTLADEYDAAFPAYPKCNVSADCPEPNVTLRSTREKIKWATWIDAGTPVPTPEGTRGFEVGLFEGARYQTLGVYRPVDTRCRMRALGLPFCPVCMEGLVVGLWGRVSPIDRQSPEPSTLARDCDELRFEATPVPLPQVSWQFSWRVDDEVIDGGANSLVIPAGSLASGVLHVVTVEAHDATPFVRNDPDMVTRATARWSVEVSACDAAPACGDAGVCATGFCVDGVCCDSACQGVCAACNLPGQAGHCAPTTGAPRAACTADPSCAHSVCGGAETDSCTCAPVAPVVKKPGCHCGSGPSTIELALLGLSFMRRRKAGRGRVIRADG